MTAVSFFFTAVKKAVLTLAVVTLEKTFKVEKKMESWDLIWTAPQAKK